MKSAKEFIKLRTDLSNAENIVYIAAAAPFLPFQLTIPVVAILSFYVLFNKDYRYLAFSVSGSFLIPIFVLFTLSVALAYKNYLGCAASIAFFFMIMLEHFMRAVMTREIYERALNICCLSSLFAAFVAIIEKLIHFNDIWYRCSGNFFSNQLLSFYSHPNYLGALMAISLLICAYKVIVKKEKKRYYYFIAFLNAAAILLTASMFALIEVFIGLSMLLLLARRHQLLGVLFIVTAFAAFILYTNPQIFPRTAHIDSTFNSRVLIWDTAIKAIKQSIWTGRGFFAFGMIMPEHPHTHNLLFEFLLDFGIIGSAILLAIMFIVCQKIVICKNFLRKSKITLLILAVFCAVLIHSITDITVFWLQTGLLYAFILSGIGAEEQVLYRIFKKKKAPAKIEEGSKNE